MLGEPTEAMRFRSKIEKDLNRSGNLMTIEDLYAFVLTGDMQLWLGQRSIFFTEIVCYPRAKVLRLVIAAGELENFFVVGPTIAAWAISQGCDRAEFVGRKGWTRRLPLWRETAVMMTADLKDLL